MDRGGASETHRQVIVVAESRVRLASLDPPYAVYASEHLDASGERHD
jgi:hypothetical protein